ncbi:MAG: Fis family transcriptional regulator [Desulfovibrionales bacterium GWA2_65_9]|nr:MAG: Fis family transcriptional regulator [Desulfovibrionales bacterium GWA2_65_9]
MFKILIIDDDQSICHMFERIARKLGHETVTAQSLAEGLACLNGDSFDCVFLDVSLPDGNGIDAIPAIKSAPSEPEVVIITGYGDPDGAELAITNGAWSYIEKTSNLEQVTLALNQALKFRERSKACHAIVLKRDAVVGVSAAMHKVLDGLAQAATSKANVLLHGETGTGKELMARTIHDNSGRAAQPFVVVDCATLPDNLVESILFGHAKGAFTGADGPHEGLVKQADGGTLFLDEVGELPLSTQKSFLRVIQERSFRPVGGKKEIASDFRLIAATNKDLEQMCALGLFRQDLLFRLKTFVIELPSLRERKEDIKALATHYVAKLCESYGIPCKGISPEVLAGLQQHDWPGNVRELTHVLERMIIAAGDTPMLHLEHLPQAMRARAARQSVQPRMPKETPHGPESGVLEAASIDMGSATSLPTFKEFRKALVDNADKAYLKRLLELSGGSLKQACVIAGLGRTRLYNLLKDHGITK